MLHFFLLWIRGIGVSTIFAVKCQVVVSTRNTIKYGVSQTCGKFGVSGEAQAELDLFQCVVAS